MSKYVKSKRNRTNFFLRVQKQEIPYITSKIKSTVLSNFVPRGTSFSRQRESANGFVIRQQLGTRMKEAVHKFTYAFFHDPRTQGFYWSKC